MRTCVVSAITKKGWVAYILYKHCYAFLIRCPDLLSLIYQGPGPLSLSFSVYLSVPLFLAYDVSPHLMKYMYLIDNINTHESRIS